MLTATQLNSYKRKLDGKPMMRLLVSGSKQELTKFKEVQGQNYREDEETAAPLFFMSQRDAEGNRRAIPKRISLTYYKTQDGREGYFYDEEKLISETIDQAIAMALPEMTKQIVANWMKQSGQIALPPQLRNDMPENKKEKDETIDDLIGKPQLAARLGGNDELTD